MKLALISDIHGNLEALTAVLADIDQQRVDTLCCLGDVVGYGSEPSACLELVTRHCDVKLMGNHEYVILGRESSESYTHVARISAEWTGKQLTDHDFSVIAGFAMDYRFDDLYLVHASPFEPEQWHYVLSPDEAAAAFEALDGNVCFHGHSHIPIIFAELPDRPPRGRLGHSFLADRDNRYLINIGSVGQPRDSDPRACYVTFDTDEREVCYHRVEYDIKAAQHKMAQAQLPEMLIQRLAAGR
ncbi:MAG TPA: metallophosphoesterase family protein [Candidatus Deferrimicrobium sp.]|nr:metallophosphoesterase family protein [Candidatus Deferrimicrobium sp.]